MALPPGEYSMERMRAFTNEQLFELMFTCQSPGYYQFCVEELQRRFLLDLAGETKKLSDSAARLESTTTRVEDLVGQVGRATKQLADSSGHVEKLTRWLTGLTVALLALATVQVAVMVLAF